MNSVSATRESASRLVLHVRDLFPCIVRALANALRPILQRGADGKMVIVNPGTDRVTVTLAGMDDAFAELAERTSARVLAGVGSITVQPAMRSEFCNFVYQRPDKPPCEFELFRDVWSDQLWFVSKASAEDRWDPVAMRSEVHHYLHKLWSAYVANMQPPPSPPSTSGSSVHWTDVFEWSKIPDDQFPIFIDSAVLLANNLQLDGLRDRLVERGVQVTSLPSGLLIPPCGEDVYQTVWDVLHGVSFAVELGSVVPPGAVRIGDAPDSADILVTMVMWAECLGMHLSLDQGGVYACGPLCEVKSWAEQGLRRMLTSRKQQAACEVRLGTPPPADVACSDFEMYMAAAYESDDDSTLIPNIQTVDTIDMTSSESTTPTMLSQPSKKRQRGQAVTVLGSVKAPATTKTVILLDAADDSNGGQGISDFGVSVLRQIAEWAAKFDGNNTPFIVVPASLDAIDGDSENPTSTQLATIDAMFAEWFPGVTMAAVFGEYMGDGDLGIILSTTSTRRKNRSDIATQIGDNVVIIELPLETVMQMTFVPN